MFGRQRTSSFIGANAEVFVVVDTEMRHKWGPRAMIADPLSQRGSRSTCIS